MRPIYVFPSEKRVPKKINNQINKQTNKQITTAREDEYSASTPKDVISDSLLILISLEHDRFTTQPFYCTIVYVCAYASMKMIIFTNKCKSQRN